MNGSDAHYPITLPKLHTRGVSRMQKQDPTLIGFDPVKFIELLLKLDGRAKGHEVEVEVRKCENKERREAG